MERCGKAGSANERQDSHTPRCATTRHPVSVNCLGQRRHPCPLPAWCGTRGVRRSQTHRGDGSRLGREAYGISNKIGEAGAARFRDFISKKERRSRAKMRHAAFFDLRGFVRRRLPRRRVPEGDASCLTKPRTSGLPSERKKPLLRACLVPEREVLAEADRFLREMPE